jgi:hypothetical protein
MLSNDQIACTSVVRILLSLTLLCNIHLEIGNVTDKRLLPPFPVMYALLELLKVPLHTLVIREKLVDWRLAECQLTAFMEDIAYVLARTAACHTWP